MVNIPVKELIPVLQIAIGPVILISGVGLVLLTLANRFGRAVDRSRQLDREMRASTPPDRQRLAGQVNILYRRARLIRLAITMATLCVLLVAVLIISLFIAALFKWEVGSWIVLLFVSCLISLIIAMGAFIREVQLSLTALQLELQSHGADDGSGGA